jgi:hypothetical protein
MTRKNITVYQQDVKDPDGSSCRYFIKEMPGTAEI